MKKLIFIHGPNGVGKSILCKALNSTLENSAWLDSEWCRMTNPFTFNDEVINMVEKNMSFMLRSYLECSSLKYVIYNYGFQGPRKKIFENVMKNISDLEFEFIPVTITCSYKENIVRMIKDGRDEERINRALASRNIYESLGWTSIDTTELSVEETVCRVLQIIKE